MAISNSALTKKTLTEQQVCIDLPGETVQCWRSADKIKVVLRKHRDIIFDLHLENGKTYSVHATESDFYNARDKKLVYALRRESVIFRDGERLHLWVTRSFKGALILKCGNEILMKLSPNEIDKHQYGDAPKEKPAPIIVSLGKTNTPAPVNRSTSKPRAIQPPKPVAAPIDDECAIVCVVEGTIKGIPESIGKHFAKGGGDSGLIDIDPFDVATRNWIWGQVAGSVAYIHDNWEWLKASIDKKTHTGIHLVSAKVHMVRGKVRFYFSGYSRYNTIFGPGGFGPGHDRIMTIFAGAGKTASSFSATAKGVAGTFKGNALVSFIFGSLTAIEEWMDDVKKDGYDLAANLFMGIIKAIVASAIAVIIVSLLVLVAMIFFEVALCVIAVGVITVVVGLVANYLVEVADKKIGKLVTGDDKNTDGLSAPLSEMLRKFGHAVKSSWEDLMKKFPNDYREILY